MLLVLAGKPLSSGQVGGRMPVATRFWTTDQIIVWKVVGACWVVVTVAVFADAGVVVISGKVGAGGPVLVVSIPVVSVGSVGLGAGRGGIGGAGITDVDDVMVEMDFCGSLLSLCWLKVRFYGNV